MGAGRPRACGARGAGAPPDRWGYPAGFLDAASAAELEPALQPSAPTAEVAWFPGESYLLTEPAVGYLAGAAAARGPAC